MPEFVGMNLLAIEKKLGKPDLDWTGVLHTGKKETGLLELAQAVYPPSAKGTEGVKIRVLGWKERRLRWPFREDWKLTGVLFHARSGRWQVLNAVRYRASDMIPEMFQTCLSVQAKE